MAKNVQEENLVLVVREMLLVHRAGSQRPKTKGKEEPHLLGELRHTSSFLNYSSAPCLTE